ncbi:ABC transporter permease [Parabacteroides sp. PF5-9]|uniref:ABC transporter permease n=1 Tax=Parabacteroides sp. PF5-9 TaxID=1742404 RepID=UPI002475C5E6|nr:ABC transporter permease [Parabacteroides sp. PF5-9]MDH6356472.1 putative ABC transport system permease protein [Parabacteroides sp. PF5-9]
MKTILRNFQNILRRFKTATFLNIAGLSVAFSVFIIIMMQIAYDLGFNKSVKNADRIFRIETVIDGEHYAITSRPLLENLLKDSPHIEAGAIVSAMQASVNNSFFYVEQNRSKDWYSEKVIDVSKGFPDVFQFEMTEGLSNAIEQPNTVLIPESMARKMFGNNMALNKLLIGETFRWTIGGVYRDFPSNTSVANVIYKEINPEKDITEWNNLNYESYLRLDHPSSAEILELHIAEQYKGQWEESGMNIECHFTPFTQIHFNTNMQFDTVNKTSKSTLLVLVGIAFVILLIATINFTNYSVALTPLRIKSINTQKVLGASEKGLRGSLVTEAVGICFISWLIAIGLVHLLSLSSLNTLLDINIALFDHIQLVVIAGIMALVVGLFAGIYPAYYMTSFTPALVLKGSFGLSPKGRKLRNSLMGIQFVTSFVLIVVAMFMYLQTRYVHTTSLGYNKDQIIITDLNNDIRKSQEAFENGLLAFSNIESVALAGDLLSSSDYYSKWSREVKGENYMFQVLAVDLNFLKTMDIQLTAGRDFVKSDRNEGEKSYYIFNESARREFGFSVGDKLSNGEVIGFIPDINVTSLRHKIEPMAFILINDYYFSGNKWAYIRVKANTDMSAAIAHVKSTLNSLSPEYAFNVRLYDDILHRLYEKEQNMTSLITWFSLIAVLISIVGVFGLVVFESEYKRKEIGIRKVLGSTTGEILSMFNSRYVQILTICFVIAIPIAVYVIRIWLENFAYKTPVYWWVFALSFLLVTMITTATVTFQSWQVANANPVDSIKTE